MSRYLDRKLDQFFTKDASAVARLFDGESGTRLYVAGIGNCPGIADLTGMTVKVDLNADYDVTDSGETLAINTDFWAGPWDAPDGSEARPYRYLELNPTSSILTIWPKQLRAVEVTAIFGWPAVPSAIERATCHLTALLRLETPRAVLRRTEIGDILDASRNAQSIVTSLADIYAGVPSL